ncbi:MAG TPA: L,D-transpeptidase family protein [Acidimicrobiales bacterium]
MTRRAWVVLGVAVALIIAAVIVFSGGSSPPSHPHSSGSSGSASSHSGSGGSSRASLSGFFVKSFTPAAGSQNVAPNATIAVTFSEPVTLSKVTPRLTPNVAGKWVLKDPHTLLYALNSPLVPASHEVLTIPGGSSGVRSAAGAALSTGSTASFNVAQGDLLRVQQLLAGLNFLPLGFSPTGQAPSPADLATDQPGSFSWRWPNMPTALTSQWIQGSTNEISKAAIEAFETQNGIGVDGIAGPAVWTALINDTINHKVDATPYIYVLVNKVEPQNLTLWNNGVAQYVGIPVNTGAPGADTTDGSYAVFEHVRFSDMKGTNTDGSTYNDPNVPYASYFNGGDALHGFIRSSYGSPQSNGCVEMSYADAALVWPLTPIGTLVTVEGPNFGTAPPATTTTSTASTTTTTTTAPAPPATTTTPPAPPPAATGNTPPAG